MGHARKGLDLGCGSSLQPRQSLKELIAEVFKMAMACTQGPLKAGEGKEMDSPRELPEGSDLADTLILAQ